MSTMRFAFKYVLTKSLQDVPDDPLIQVTNIPQRTFLQAYENEFFASNLYLFYEVDFQDELSEDLITYKSDMYHGYLSTIHNFRDLFLFVPQFYMGDLNLAESVDLKNVNTFIETQRDLQNLGNGVFSIKDSIAKHIPLKKKSTYMFLLPDISGMGIDYEAYFIEMDRIADIRRTRMEDAYEDVNPSLFTHYNARKANYRKFRFNGAHFEMLISELSGSNQVDIENSYFSKKSKVDVGGFTSYSIDYQPYTYRYSQQVLPKAGVFHKNFIAFLSNRFRRV